MKKITNQASLSYNGITTNSNVVYGEISENLNVFKDATVSDYLFGDTITYIVHLQNTGDADIAGLTLTDNLGAYQSGLTTHRPLDYNEGSVIFWKDGLKQTTISATFNDTTGNLEISGLSVASKKSADIIYSATVNAFAPLGTGAQIKNIAVITGTGIDIQAEAIIRANTDTNLTITKNICPSSVAEDGEITYTFTIENTGAEAKLGPEGEGADAGAGVYIEDEFPQPFTLATNPVKLNGELWPETAADLTKNYAYSGGTFTTTAGKIAVPAAEYKLDSTTGAWGIIPGRITLSVTGTV